MKSSKPSPLWPLVLFVSIVFTYGFFVFIHMPLALLGRLFKPAWRLSGKVFSFGVSCLLFIQPWLKMKHSLNLPPKRPLLLIANHRSNLDVFILLSRVPNIRILVKEKFFKIPVFGWFLRLLKPIGIQDDNYEVYKAALKKAQNALKGGDPLVFFPEMTRCPEGLKGMNKFVLAPFHLALETKALVVPLVFLGTDRAWPKGHFGGRFRPQIQVSSLPPLDSKNFSSARALQKEVQKQMLEKINQDWVNFS